MADVTGRQSKVLLNERTNYVRSIASYGFNLVNSVHKFV